jgi:hydrophobic/amphiphilic exporter-1 (mainly G- bacteria), HAE1 family
MNVSEFCIRHPVATTLMSAALVAGGMYAYTFLPVAALPRTDSPVIAVSASLPGASPESMANSVATPLIKQLTTISGIDTISATSYQGSTSIAIEFALDRDIDSAAADVQSAIARVLRRLPPEMTDPPSYRKINPADWAVVILAITSDTAPLHVLDAYVEQVVAPAVSTVEGVAQLITFGSQKYAVRVQIHPDMLAARGIGIDEVQQAIAAANASTPVGSLANRKQQIALEARTNLKNADEFRNIIVAVRNGHPVRLGEVAKVTDSVENDRTASWYNGKRGIILGVYRQPDANTVAVVEKVKALLPTFDRDLPPGASLHVLNDRSQSIRDAVHDVQTTLGLIIVLVILVIFLFLRRLTATIIPALAVPISLIATLGAMYLFGFSINNVSLLGMTLAVGLVVDDAIVMLENIYRHMEKSGLRAFDAALIGSREIWFTIISITVSLVAVFIPVLLMGGVVGRVFHEFAVVVTTAIAVSAFVSLTLTPMLASKVLRAGDTEQPERGWSAVFERGFDATLRLYERGLDFCLKYRPLMLLVFVATIGATAWLLVTIPKGFFPQEDIGQLRVTTEARKDISFEAMKALQSEVAETLRRSPYVKSVASIVGSSSRSQLSQGRMFVELKPRDQRPPMHQVLHELRRQLAPIAGIRVFMQPRRNLRIGAHFSRAQYQFVMQSIDKDALYKWSAKMTDLMSRDPTFLDVNNDLEINATQATLVVDKDKARQHGITAEQLRSSLYSGFGNRQVSSIYATGDSYSVILEFDPKIDWSTADLPDVRIRNNQGKLVPIGAFARVVRTTGVQSINQLGQLPAVTISFNLPEGVALGDAVSRIDQIKKSLSLPDNITSTYSGTAKTFQAAVANQGLLLLAAVITIYIVLGILYESFIHPFTILTGLPSAIVGALLALRLSGMDLSVIAVIGILMLIGIVKKNAIMMIDVSLTRQREGAAPFDAIRQAALLRFRPIMMTTMAALVGTLPIALGAGASAELRQPLGVSVVGGLLLSQLLTLYITPVLYLYMEDLAAMVRTRTARFRKAIMAQ